MLTIIVPAYNEERLVKKTLLEAVGIARKMCKDFEVIAIDDGSTDKTASVVEEVISTEPKIRLHRFETNQGVGAAFIAGLEMAQFPFITLVPGDNAFSEKAVENVFAAVGQADLVVSYRNNMNVRTPMRRTLSVICTMLMKICTSKAIRDAHSMYVFPVDLARTLKIQDGYGYHIECLGRLLLLTDTIAEVSAPLNPNPDASSGVMRPRVIFTLGFTMLRLMLWRLRRVFSKEKGVVTGLKQAEKRQAIQCLTCQNRIILIMQNENFNSALTLSFSRRTASLLLAIICLFTFLLTLIHAQQLGLDTTEPSNRARFHAIPVALSQLYHARTHDYTANWSIAIDFQGSSQSTQALIKKHVETKPPAIDGDYYWAADDRGFGDFVFASFALFGADLTSLFYFWFLILGLSMVLALIRFFNDLPALIFITTGVFALGATISMYDRASNQFSFKETSVHISESRMLGVLGIIALVHIVLNSFRSNKNIALWLNLGTMILQVAIVTFLLHARLTVLWIFLVLMLISVGGFFYHLMSKPSNQSWKMAALTMATLVTALLSLQFFKCRYSISAIAEIGPYSVAQCNYGNCI